MLKDTAEDLINGWCHKTFQTTYWGGGDTPLPKFLETTIGMTMKSLPNVGIYNEAQNQKKILT